MNFYVYSTVGATNDDKNKKKLIRGHKSSQQAKMRSRREGGLRKRQIYLWHVATAFDSHWNLATCSLHICERIYV